MKKTKTQLKWTEEEIKIVNSYIKKGLSYNDLINQLHERFRYRTFLSIKLKVSRLRPSLSIKNRSGSFFYSKELTDLIKKELLTTNKSLVNIAKEVSKSTDRPFRAILTKIQRISSTIPERNKIRLLNKKSETMREIKFYTIEEKNIMKKMLSTGETKRNISKKLAIQFNRSEYGIYQLLGKMRSFSSKVEPVRSLATIRAKKVLQDKKQEETLQQPAEIGIEVPHGMTFEGTPKKIMLHSDHFRIYF
jgi:hypothetical protein